jgi:hypothetical protein
MKENNDATKLEFLLKLNENIVVQRYFNVKGYNPKARASMELHDLVKSISEKIHQDLKGKALDYMNENANQIISNPEILDTSNTDGPEYFNVYIRIGDETICHRIWDAKVYPPKTRYTVDVRPHLKKLLRDLTDIFSTENLNYTYLEYQLV